MLDLVPVVDPVVGQIKVSYLFFVFKVLYLADEIVMEVKFCEVGAVLQSFNHFDLIEGEDECLELDEATKPIDLLDLVVKKVEICYVYQIVLLAQVLDYVLINLFKLCPKGYVWWQVLFNDCFWVVLVFNKLIVVFKKFFDMELHHNLIQILLEAAHVGAIKVTG